MGGAVCGLCVERKWSFWGGVLGNWGDLGLGAGVGKALKRLCMLWYGLGLEFCEFLGSGFWCIL